MGAATTGTVKPNRSPSHVRTDNSLPLAADDATESTRPRGRRSRPDDDAAREWADQIAVACGWPQKVRRFKVPMPLRETL
jgi:hypothetical protein